MLCFGTSRETFNRLSIMYLKVSYRAFIRLSEHGHNVVRTLKEYRCGRVKHSSKCVSRRERCPLEHVHISNNMFTSLCVTTDVVIFDVSQDVPSVVIYYTDVMLDVPIKCTH